MCCQADFTGGRYPLESDKTSINLDHKNHKPANHANMLVTMSSSELHRLCNVSAE